VKLVKKLLRGLLLKPTLNLLNWILRSRDGNSLIGGGPLGWNWYATLAAMATDHHGNMSGFGGSHHAHGQLSGVGIDDHHARDHASRHGSGGADAVSLDASQIGTGRFGMARMPDGTSGHVLTAQGAGANPVYAAPPGVPSGLIAIWHGLIANIPSGWVICDGNNSTPNLLTRFVRSVATAGTNPGATGGSATHTLSVAEMPAHAHTQTGKQGAPAYGTYSIWPCSTFNWGDITQTGSSAGGGSAHNNLPPYYDVAFIMKT